MILTFGCSHTAGTLKTIPWHRLYAGQDKVMSFAEGGSSFEMQVSKAKYLNKNRKQLRYPTAIVLQKTHPCRYPWFCPPEKFSASKALNLYFGLPKIMREELLSEIFQKDKELLDEFVDCFPQVSRFAIWSYWMDAYCSNDEVSHKYVKKFHEYAITKGFDDLWTAVDAEPIIKEASQYEMFSDEWRRFLTEKQWICAEDDCHAATELNGRIAESIRAWVEKADVAERQTR